ncbi:MAG: hypothetical protein JWO58_2687, partial [Chitinophagaceae bacterium]|nr:hypothetical protein [Chitinophagaceae bacterium]
DEWYQALEKLIVDAELRRTMGRQARIRVEEKYSIHANRDTYLNILNTLFS